MCVIINIRTLWHFLLFVSQQYIALYHICITNKPNTSMVLSPSWEANSCSASERISRLLWNPSFIIVLKRARHSFLSWAGWSQSTHTPFLFRKIHCNIFLPSTPVFKVASYLQVFQPTFCTLFSHVCYMPCLSHPTWFDNHNIILWTAQIMKILIV
jgi:hypothetical protein